MSHTCTYLYPNLTITVSSAFLEDLSFDLIVSPIINPKLADTIGDFGICHYKNSTCFQEINSSNIIEIQPKDMSSASLSTSSSIVAANTTWTVIFTISQSLTSGSTIELITPIWNKDMSGSYTRYYCSGSITCNGITGIV